jgi:hypothetical protein
MDTNHNPPDIESFISATLDSERLKLISYISQESFSALDLAKKMDQEPASLLRHLDILEQANLLTITENEGIKHYRFNSKSIESIARQQFEKPRPDMSTIDLPEDQRKLVSSYIQPDGSLKMIPTQSKKIRIVLEYIIKSFEFDTHYSEKEVNEILKKYNPDTAILRRYLVDYQYLDRERDGSKYWRPNAPLLDPGVA